MARWADDHSEEESARLLALLKRLVASKPNGWSAVSGDREVILRPADRGLGKLSVTVSPSQSGPVFRLGFFSQSANRWDGHAHFPLSTDSAQPILEWAQSRVAREMEARLD